MQTVGIDIGTTTISGVVLEKNGTQKPRILKAKTIENGSFLTTTKDWERIQDAEKLVKIKTTTIKLKTLYQSQE